MYYSGITHSELWMDYSGATSEPWQYVDHYIESSCSGTTSELWCSGTTLAITVGLQWTPSNLATLGISQSVLIRGVASFQG